MFIKEKKIVYIHKFGPDKYFSISIRIYFVLL